MIKIITGFTYKSCVSFVMPQKIKFSFTKFLCGASQNQMSNNGVGQFQKRKSSPSSPIMGKSSKKKTGSNQGNKNNDSGRKETKEDSGIFQQGAGKGNNTTQTHRKPQESESSQRSRGGHRKHEGRNNHHDGSSASSSHREKETDGTSFTHLEFDTWNEDDEKDLKKIRSPKDGDTSGKAPKNKKEKFQQSTYLPPGAPREHPQVLGSSVDNFKDDGGHSSSVDKVEKTAPAVRQTSISEFVDKRSSASYQPVGYSEQRNSQSTKPDQGIGIEKLNKAPSCFKTELSPQEILDSLPNHFLLSEGKAVLGMNESRQINYRDVVTLPFSDMRKYGEYTRWDHVIYYLERCRNISDEQQLEELIQSIRQVEYKRRDNFEAFYRFFQELRDRSINLYNQFFRETLPQMINLALALPRICNEEIPFLKKETNMSLTLSQSQVACLLMHAFFCTFPHRPGRQEKGHEVPDINFSSLYSTFDEHGGRGDKSNREIKRKVQKLHCLVHYFTKVTHQKPEGNVTYQRVYDDCKHMKWHCLETTLTQLHVDTDSTIEEIGAGMLQADFANKFVGGGVLTTGLVQEEIRFVLCPEMILSRLFTEALTDKDVLLMTGCERFSNYSGYSDTFQFKGDYLDKTSRDALGRRYTEVVAMDALVFKTNKEAQFQLRHVVRELNKAYVAFKGNPIYHQSQPAVCTGNWGCGAFGGDKQLKALIQIMAASAAGRDVCYVTFRERELNQLGYIHQLLTQKNITIKDMMTLLGAYGQKVYRTNEHVEPLFDFLQEMILTDKVSRLPPVTDNSFTEGVQSEHSERNWQARNKQDPRFRGQHSGNESFSRDSKANQHRQQFNQGESNNKQFRNDRKSSRGLEGGSEEVPDNCDRGTNSAQNLSYKDRRESNSSSENYTGYNNKNGDCSGQSSEKGGSGQQ